MSIQKIGRKCNGGRLFGAVIETRFSFTRMTETRFLTTIKDVARVAGVSIATVSRAFSNPGRSSPEMVAHVRAVSEEMGYVQHRAAGSLVSRRFRTIGAVVPTIDNSIFARALHSLQNRLNAHGYMLVIASNSYDSSREAAALKSLIEHGIDAAVLVGALHAPEVMRLIDAKQLPFVNTWTFDPTSAYPTIGFDNRGAMRRLAEHLLDLGHRSVGVIAGIMADNDRATGRVEGVRDALTARGLALPAELIIEAEYTIRAGREAMSMLRSRNTELTAVICGNDILAFGAILECVASGIAVPQAISIAGFDDFELSQHIIPCLTTVRVPAQEIGAAAGDYLVTHLAAGSAHRHLDLGADLIVRASTAAPALPSPR
ncbi:MAG TPA: substrate-binding domain-containing protein [Acidiphilium sp.]|nr:substrate-binding domain-containing protein [Acidiphilium sp.]